MAYSDFRWFSRNLRWSSGTRAIYYFIHYMQNSTIETEVAFVHFGQIIRAPTAQTALNLTFAFIRSTISEKTRISYFETVVEEHSFDVKMKICR